MKEAILIAWLAGASADAASTHYGLAHGAHEVILSQNPWVDDGILAGEAAVGSLGSLWLARRRPKLALGMSLAFVVVRGFIAAHNMGVR